MKNIKITKKMIRARAILFDMDGVITDTMPYHFDAWKKIFDSIGIGVNCYDVYKREGQAGLQSLKEILREYNRPFKLREAKRMLAQKEEMFKSAVKIRFIKGSLKFISQVKKKGFAIGLVTGTSRHEAHKILPKNIFNKFDAVITGNDVRRGKPDPEPYLKCLKKLGISANDAVVIENAPFGIESAKRARLFCVALETSLPKSYLKGADIVIKSFHDIRQKIAFSYAKP